MRQKICPEKLRAAREEIERLKAENKELKHQVKALRETQGELADQIRMIRNFAHEVK